MAEPTSALTFDDLVLEAALTLGNAYYGADGDAAAQVPTDAHDLALCKRIVNNAIRMFMADGPAPSGWRFLRPVASIDLWPSVAVDSTNPVTTATLSSGSTTVTITSAGFYETMVGHTLTITDVGSFTITSYTSSTVVVVSGDASAAHNASKTWSITADGNYTLPTNFGGQVEGQITYEADTDLGSGIDWTDEATIRRWREDGDDNSGDPLWAAIRPRNGTIGSSNRRRWELMAYPTPDEVVTVEFPYLLSFDELTTGTEVPLIPFSHDEALKAAVRAVVEKDEDRMLGVHWDYYRNVALVNSHRIDAQAAPKKLGKLGNPSSGMPSGSGIRGFRNWAYQRPTVTFNQ